MSHTNIYQPLYVFYHPVCLLRNKIPSIVLIWFLLVQYIVMDQKFRI